MDRYWSITSPLKYLGKRTKSRALIMISFAWSISILWLVPITGWPYFFNRGQRTVAIDKCNTEYDKNIFFKMSTAIVNFYIPLIAMIAINTKIYLVIHKRYKNPIMRYSSIVSNELGANRPMATCRHKSFSICSSIEEEKTCNKTKQKPSDNNKFLNQKCQYLYSNETVGKLFRSKSVQHFQSIDCLDFKEAKSDSNCDKQHSDKNKICLLLSNLKESPIKTSKPFSCEKKHHEVNLTKLKSIKKSTINRKGFMNRQEKAFKQLSSIVIGFTFCFTPYFIVFLIVAICENCVSDEVYTVTVWFGYLNSTINPFLYALSNKKIKKEKNQFKINTTTTNDFYRKKSIINSRKSIW